MTTWLRALALATSAGLLAIPLAHALAYPTRISVLSSLQIDAPQHDSIAIDLVNRRTFEAVPPRHPPGFVTFLALIYAAVGHSWVAGKIALGSSS